MLFDGHTNGQKRLVGSNTLMVEVQVFCLSGLN